MKEEKIIDAIKALLSESRDLLAERGWVRQEPVFWANGTQPSQPDYFQAIDAVIEVWRNKYIGGAHGVFVLRGAEYFLNEAAGHRHGIGGLEQGAGVSAADVLRIFDNAEHLTERYSVDHLIKGITALVNDYDKKWAVASNFA